MSKTPDDNDPTPLLPDGWEQFTSPEGHRYFYNAATKESRWSLPSEVLKREAIAEHRDPRRRRSNRDKRRKPKSVLDTGKLLIEHLEDGPSDQMGAKATKREAEGTAGPASSTVFQQLQASLEGRLGAMHAGPGLASHAPRRHDDRMESGDRQTVEVPSVSVEEQHEAETAGMSAAERLRFLRKKRQESMMWKRKSVASDPFMEEVASNMMKKGVVAGRTKREEDGGEKKRVTWKEQETAEEERKRQQMQKEKEARERKAERKRRQEQIARDREEQREQPSAEELEVEQLRDQPQEEKKDDRNEGEAETTTNESDSTRGACIDEHEPDRYETVKDGQNGRQHATVAVESTAEQGEETTDAVAAGCVDHERQDQSRGNECDTSTTRESTKQVESVENGQPPTYGRPSSETHPDADCDEKQRVRKERRAQKRREKELLAASKLRSVAPEASQSRPASSSNKLDETTGARLPSNEAEERVKATEKQLRRERRRVARLEAAMAAQHLHGNGSQVNTQQAKVSETHTDSSNSVNAEMVNNGIGTASGQPGPSLFSGGMYPPYPYMMMPPLLPPPAPYGYYYPYMQPPPVPMPMYPPEMVPPGYQSMLSTPPHSAAGMTMPSALVPYGSESTLANAHGYGTNFNGMQSGSELSRCDCCKGIGVGLVEKNGVCAHCNRLRLAFIVDSAQMRLRCSLCGGWGFQLLQANGMCGHCTRQTAQSSPVISATHRPNRVTSVVEPRMTATESRSKIDDTDWDKSSSDDSDWDD
ncbi:unnamed protein product [Hyaloperonospora brassicae]|uniref:WW domain-containing protein n=1 Tax=Hyaloperonospora brassicae TaxID=162125 RepID=A0AAV0UF27_HYABA|nr:unnamed protein product [Hyaloperonospora brassicae]